VNLAFNMMFLHAHFDPTEIRRVVDFAEQLIPAECQPTWAAGSHDNRRFATRWCRNDPMKTRAAMVMLLTLRGTPFLYYGDELGMPQTDVPADRILDPVGKLHGARLGRDGERTPMQWTADDGAGFTESGVEPWLPFGDPSACNVADQRHDPDSMLSLTRDLIGVRNALPDLRRGSYRALPSASESLWVWSRGDRTLVAVNFSDAPASVPDVDGDVRLSTIRARDGESVSGTLHLEPWEATIVLRRQ
jgi:alpha-glucosidase